MRSWTHVGLLFVTLATPAAAGEPPVVHDCRIARIDLKATRNTAQGRLTIRGLILARDGAPLNQRDCPDMVGLTWYVYDGRDVTLEPSGFIVRVEGLQPGDLVKIGIGTSQRMNGPDPVLFARDKTFRF